MPEILEKNKMVMKYYVGEATGDNEEKYELSIGIGNSAPIIKLPTGETVIFNWDELINSAIKEKDQLKVAANS